MKQTTGYVIGKWVLEMEAMELHKMELLVESQDGVVLEVATDAVRYKMPYGRARERTRDLPDSGLN